MLSPEFPGADLPELGRGFGKVVPLSVHKVSRGNDEVRRRRPDLQEKVEMKTAVDQEKTQQKQPHVKFPLRIRTLPLPFRNRWPGKGPAPARP